MRRTSARCAAPVRVPRAAARRRRAGRAGGSPTKKGATTSCSSSASPAPRNCVSTLRPALDQQPAHARGAPRSSLDPASIDGEAPASTTVATAPSRSRRARRPPGSRSRRACRTSPVAKIAARGSRCGCRVTVTLRGVGGRPSATRRARRSATRTSEPRVVGTHGAGADEDRVAAGPHRVDPVEVGLVRQHEPLVRRVVEAAVERHRAAQHGVGALSHAAHPHGSSRTPVTGHRDRRRRAGATRGRRDAGRRGAAPPRQGRDEDDGPVGHGRGSPCAAPSPRRRRPRRRHPRADPTRRG